MSKGLILTLLALSAGEAHAGAKPQVKLLKSRVEGQAGATAVLTQMAKKQVRSLESCYGKVLKKKPGEVGEIHFEATISPGGRMVSIKKSSKTNVTGSLYNCAKSKVRGWRLRPWSPTSRVVAGLTFGFRLTAPPPTGYRGARRTHQGVGSRCLHSAPQRAPLLSAQPP